MREYFLHTARIAFSHWLLADYKLAHLLWGEEAVTKYISKSGAFTDQEIDDRLSLKINNEKLFHVQYWPMFEIETNEFIGCCGLRPHGMNDYTYEVGFHLRSRYWGKGLASEAAIAIIQYTFNHLKAKELFAGHNPNNVNSKKILEKLGFSYIGDEFYEPTGLNHPTYRYTFEVEAKLM